ncbi:MAG TPA: ABC transporter substrate-binding protein [Steroidobacteraceae bacterium]|nr:ABC transporter substrate-binding protein [Steroidobacteraceae bacterium]
MSAIEQLTRGAVRAVAAITIGLAWLDTSAAETLAPDQVIATTATAVAEAVAKRRDELERDRAKLHALIGELLRPQFDLPAACRLILREHWTAASPEQRKRFEAAFYHFLLASYAHALLEFRFDTVTVLPLDEPPGESAVHVKTMMKLTDGSRYHVVYYMRPTEKGWKIVDVIAEGVSYVRTYRTDFGAEIREHGLDALIERLLATT